MNQLQENQNGCLEQKNEDEGINSILEELETYICDKICLRDTKLTQEEQEQYCAGCKLESYVDRIGQEYDKINTFDKTAAYQLMKKIQKYRVLSGMRISGIITRRIYLPQRWWKFVQH